VFENPQYQAGTPDQYIVKRVIAFPGERVSVKDCKLLIYNDQNPDGFNPYDDIDIKPDCVSGTSDSTVPSDNLYVVGDHRNGHHSLDSRNALGTVPFANVIGPVGLQILPIDKFRVF
jgi:signal peptidase I